MHIDFFSSRLQSHRRSCELLAVEQIVFAHHQTSAGDASRIMSCDLLVPVEFRAPSGPAYLPGPGVETARAHARTCVILVTEWEGKGKKNKKRINPFDQSKVALTAGKRGKFFMDAASTFKRKTYLYVAAVQSTIRGMGSAPV